MVELEIDYEEAVSALDKFSNDIDEVVEKATEDVMEKIVEDAKRTHRFRTRTGTLESAVQKEIKQYTASVFIDNALAPYGTYIHEGHRSWAPDPFLEEAFRRHQSELDSCIQSAIDHLIKKLNLD